MAVVDSEGSGLSYAELDALSSDLALVLNVFDSSSKVGVYLNRSPEFIVSILGILKSGRAFVSLDIEAPAERIQHIVDDAGLEVVVSNSRLSEKLIADNISLIDVDNFKKEKTSTKNFQDNNLAYLMYTSGSSGKPK